MLRGACVVLTLIVLTAACATTHAPVTSAAEGWTGSLAALGLDGSLDGLDRPRVGRVAQVSYCGQADEAAGAALQDKKTDEGIVLADLTGPGCVVRLWTENPTGRLKVYIDDAATPALDTSFASLFDGLTEPFPFPLVGHAAGAGYSYVPIPYRQRCRLVLSETDVVPCYEITYAQYPADTPIQSFSAALTGSDRDFFRDWVKAWSRGQEVRFVHRDTEKYHRTRNNLWPEEDIQIWVMDGPGTITEFELGLSAKDPAALHQVWLAMYWDDQPEPAVLAPVAEFFGDATTPGLAAYGGPAFGRYGDRMWCRFPMPFRRSAQIRLINTTESKIDFAYGVTWRPGDVGDALYFNARYDNATPAPGEPYQAARVVGAGHVVGCTFAAQGGETLDALNGKAILMLDGGSAGPLDSAAIGHFFNAPAQFEGGPYLMPTHGCTARTQPPLATAAAYRACVTDAAPFTGEMALLFEHGPQNAVPGTYASVVYWYQTALGPAPWPVSGMPEPIHVRAPEK